MGLATDFTPVAALARGHGRAACALLLDLLGAVANRVPLPPKRPVHPAPEADGGEEEGAAGGEGASGWGGQGEGEAGGEGERDEAVCVLTRASPMPPGHADLDGEGDEGGQGAGLWRLQPPASGVGPQAAGPPGQPQGRGANGGGGGAGAAGEGGGGAVDPAAWRAELERLGPALSRIRLAHGAGEGLGAWGLRWQKQRKVGGGRGSCACLCACAGAPPSCPLRLSSLARPLLALL